MIIAFDRLNQAEFNLENIFAAKQNIAEKGRYTYIGKPRKDNMLLLVCRAQAVYTYAGGKTLSLGEGDILYAPAGCEYSTVFFNTDAKEPTSICVVFDALRGDGERIRFDGTLTKFSAGRGGAAFLELFRTIADQFLSGSPSICSVKAALYEILHLLSRQKQRQAAARSGFSLIEKGIACLESERSFSMTIAQIAGECNVSETYFRRLFTRYAGVSPNEFRLLLKIRTAKRYLKNTEMTLDEIARLLSFSDLSYFCRVFKKKTGITPSEYRK